MRSLQLERHSEMATNVEAPNLNTESNVPDFESNSNDTTISCAHSSVDHNLPAELKSDDSAEPTVNDGTLQIMRFLLF